MPQGSKSFLFRYTFNGKPKTIGLGATHTVGLAEARALAQTYRAMVLSGDDPKVERERQKADKKAVANPDFQWCAEQYIAAHKADWKNAKHAHQWHQSLQDYAYPKIGPMPVRKIDVHHVMDVLKPIWTTKTETATRIRGRIERILGWSAISGYRSGENPARWQAYLSELLPKPRKVTKRKHHSAVPHREITAFLIKLRAQSDSVSARALEFLTLTAMRTGEVIGARWSEFDLDKKVWTVPAERMKAKRPHAVPLERPGSENREESLHIFPTNNSFFGGLSTAHTSRTWQCFSSCAA
jgi:integrase